MIDGLLLDTHIALWLDSGDEKLRPSTRDAIHACRRRGGTVFLSAVTTWEIAQLLDKGRLTLDLPLDQWVLRFVGRAGVEAVPLDHKAAILAYQLRHLEHRDPGDRLLIASAIILGCPFVTYDERIRSFGQAHGWQYGFTLAE